MSMLLLLALLAPASLPASQPTSGPTSQPTSLPVVARFELEVVAIYRPLDLKGRFVSAPREVFLRLKRGPEDPKKLIGARLEVRRRRPLRERADLPPSMGLLVARLEITQARGRVVTARIVEEGLSPGLALRTVQVGDFASGNPKPPPPPKRRRVKRKRKKKPKEAAPKPFRRAKTIWEL